MEESDVSACKNIMPDAKMCLEKGAEISQWFMERFLNPGHLCN